jgi:hypothetical protein
MKKYTEAEKVQLKSLKTELRKITRHMGYWISHEEKERLMDWAGPFGLPETLRELGYQITDKADSGAIHLEKIS